MTKKDLKELNNILSSLNQAEAFIVSDSTQVARKFGDEFIPITKEIGSNLSYLFKAKRELTNFIKNKTNDRPQNTLSSLLHE